ncbi:MAG: DUF2911 domain-containing protein [Verrucomicrobia bacterium]|nr:DUF2911 domain-containing protein [Verrucomicrobiota bacterium]
MKSTTLRSLPVIAAALALAASLTAQTPAGPKLEFPAPSPNSTVKQRVGVTDVEINYARPSMKGRTIFGGLVPLGKVWRTGANTATKIAFSTAVKLNGTAVPAGAYELFTIAAAKQSMELAARRPGEIKEEYTRLNEALIASVR